MMMSTIASRSLRLSANKMVAPRAFISRGFAVGDTFKSKEKVEEDRYMREQEKEFFEKKKAAAAKEMLAQELAVYEEAIAPAMVEAQEALKKTGDKVSDAGLEALAKWKLHL